MQKDSLDGLPSLTSLVELACWRAVHQADRLAYCFLKDGLKIDGSLTYAELDRQARAVAGFLQSQTRVGDRVLVLFPPGLDFVRAFWGCLYAGVLAVPTPPVDLLRIKKSQPRLESIVKDAQISAILTTSLTKRSCESEITLREGNGRIPWFAAEEIHEDWFGKWRQPEYTHDRIAYLQYTSGSTSEPKGVMVSHGNLLHHCRYITQDGGYGSHAVTLSWMPHFHDYGLVKGIVQPLSAGIPTYLMPALAFLKRPARWLEAIERYGVTHSGGPNFAYRHCVRAITLQERKELNLHSWRVASCGAEPISKETMDQFVEAFEPSGFRREAFYPAYGLAEFTLLAALKRQNEQPNFLHLDGRALEKGIVRQAREGSKDVRTVMSCGHPVGSTQVAVVHAETRTPCPSHVIGEIWLRDPSVGKGYWNRPEETRRTFEASLSGVEEGPFLRTGDLGFLHEGQLFVTGRLKDLIIIRGRNHYPQDIESTAARSHPTLREAPGAAFSVDVEGEERLVVVQEVERRERMTDSASVIGAIRSAISEYHDLQVYAVVLIRAGSIPKTSSGKLQRRACKDAFLSNRLTTLTTSVLGEEAEEYHEKSLTRDDLLAIPTDKRETLLIAYLEVLVGKLLHVSPKRLSADQSLNMLGIDSLMAAEIAHELELRFGVSISLSTLLNDLTIHALGMLVLNSVTGLPSGRTSEAPDEKSSRSSLSHNQSALWFLHRLAPDSKAANAALMLAVRGSVDLVALRHALQALGDRHAILRTTYAVEHGLPCQQIHSMLSIHFEATDAATWTFERVKAAAAEASEAVFDLERGPVWRAHLFRRSETDAWLLLVAHHIAVDGWSMEILVEDFRRLYGSIVTNEDTDVLPAAKQYSEFVRWQDGLLASSKGTVLGAYWQQKLSGELPVLDLSHDRPRPSIQRDNSAWRSFRLSEALTRRLKALAKAQGTTLYTMLVAAVQVLLYRSTGQDDILIGSPMFGRSRAAFAETVGDCVNIVVLRDHLSGSLPFIEFLAQTRRTVLEAIDHQDYPFSLLVEQLQPVRDLTRAPLVQALFVLQTFTLLTLLEEATEFDQTPVSIDRGPLQIKPYVIPQRTGQFDLTIEMSETGGALEGCFEYNADLFDAETIERMQEHFHVLLKGIVEQPGQPLSELPLMTADERRQVLVAWNDTRTKYSDTRCLHELFDAQVARAPEAVAVMHEERRLTYRELQRRANQLGHRLRKCGVGPDVLVGLCVERSVDLIVGLLGILKAGGAYVPLDPEYPKKRLTAMLEDARAPILVTQQHLNARLPDHDAQTIYLETSSSTIVQVDEECSASGVTSGNLAYVIYTSGSTGKPKGVMVEHRSVVNYAEAMATQVHLVPGDRTLQLASISFDTAAEEIFPCLMRGATLVLRTSAMLDSMSGFLQKCREWQVTVLDLPTAYWHQLATHLHAERLGLPPDVHSVVIGGERALRQPLVAWRQHVGHRVKLFNTYGPTEVTVAATMCDLTEPETDLNSVREVPIGRAIQNVQVYVLDPHLQPVPIGTPGELFVAGVGLARGYFKLPDLTAERFIRNPFNSDTHARLYRTGDMVRWAANGTLEFLGRVDRQVKIRGHRIELGEIETALATHAGVREAVVEVREELPGDKRLVAFVVAAPQSALSVEQLRLFLRERLPDYMIPSAFVELDTLPLTPNGKVDRKALQAPATSRARIPHLTSQYVAPRDPTEQLLAQLWGEILDLKDVGVHDNFFELGGHSLLATQLFSRLRPLFQREPPLRVLFETPTIADLSTWLQKGRTPLPHAEIPSILPVSRAEPLPLSFAQERMWFLYQLAPESAAYNIPVSVRLSGPFNYEAFDHSLRVLISRHESLRTTFHAIDGRPVQVVHAELPVTIRKVDLRQTSKGSREEEAVGVVTDEARCPFNLSTGPLIRVVLVQMSDEEHLVTVTTHHIISDQWSYGVIARELVHSYNAFCEGKPSAVEPVLQIQYADFACWQRAYLQGPVLDDHLAYWRNRLAEMQILALPTDRPRPATQSFRGTYLSMDLPRSLINSLKQLSIEEGATLYMVFLAGFVTLLHRVTAQDDIAIGTPIANRNLLAIEGLIGTFVNTLVLRTDVSGEPSFRTLLARVRDTTLEAYAHQDLPFDKLVEELHPDRSHGGQPLVQVLFNFANTPFGRVDFKHLSWAPFELDRGASQFDLSLSIDPTLSKRIYLEFNTDLFDRESMERWLGHYRTLLEAIVERPDTAVSRLRLLTEQERRQLLEVWNETTTNDQNDVCFPQLFEARVKECPLRPAVSCQGQEISYHELNEKANQIAHHLRAMNVKAEDLVAVLMEPSPDLVACLLGIMKAGGAYLPLAPGLPTKRISYMLEHSGAALLVTTEKLAKMVSPTATRVIQLDCEQGSLARQSKENPAPQAGLRHLVYVIYTSGSTGQPKGVEIEHVALVNLLQSMRREPGLTAQDRFLSVTTLSFDIAGLEIYLPLLAGATVVMATREEASDGAWLREQLDDHGITAMQATPATWQMVLQAGWTGSPKLQALCGGEALSHDLAQKLLRRAGSVWNMYGPTETTIWSTLEKVDAGAETISIGRPIANTQIYILDSRLEPVPVGIPGDLYIGGLGLARGYRAAPELTNTRFVASPFLRGRERMYKTGDEARWLPDGRIECLGRSDHQVKVRGFRIELGEIESILREEQTIKDCVVISREDTPGEKRLVAYVVLRKGAALDPDQLRRKLREQVPEYMIPPTVEQLDVLPLTPNGKVDRLALPAPGEHPWEMSSRHVAPRSRLELQLAAIWEQVLEVPHISVRDNFFDLGGHSLLALQMFNAIGQSLGKRVPMSLLFQAPTIESLAEVLSHTGCVVRWNSLVAIQPGGAKPPFFVVPGVGGNVLVFARLSKLLGQEQPFYGLQSRGLDGREQPFTRVEEMAAHYVQEIRTVSPKGPYLIGGTCTGGVVAYEMAQQLSGQGERVILTIMESWHPRSHREHRDKPPIWLWPAYWRERLRTVQGFVEGPEMDHTDLVARATFHAVARYEPKAYRGRLLNVIASHRPLSDSTEDTRMAWSEFALLGDRTVFISAEDSGRLFVPPHVRELAHNLQSYLAEEWAIDAGEFQADASRSAGSYDRV
ncbi:MAG: amino acid adenylation domain-containing protein [Nitrospiraceae bacterium]